MVYIVLRLKTFLNAKFNRTKFTLDGLLWQTSTEMLANLSTRLSNGGQRVRTAMNKTVNQAQAVMTLRPRPPWQASYSTAFLLFLHFLGMSTTKLSKQTIQIHRRETERGDHLSIKTRLQGSMYRRCLTLISAYLYRVFFRLSWTQSATAARYAISAFTEVRSIKN